MNTTSLMTNSRLWYKNLRNLKFLAGILYEHLRSENACHLSRVLLNGTDDRGQRLENMLSVIKFQRLQG